mgnify:CR=1 FL=1
MKTYLVFGAAGFIGREIVRQLLAAGHEVIALVRERHDQVAKTLFRLGAIVEVINDVADRSAMIDYAVRIHKTPKFDGVIYAVGHCPPDGFLQEIGSPLSRLSLERYMRLIEMHQIGVLNVFQNMNAHLTDGGCFVFITSAITRLKGQFPPFLHAHHYASAISAEDWLVDGMRHDPAVIARKIKIHRVAPAAVDTPFHHGGPKPPNLIPVSTVVEEVIRALESDEVVDTQIV